MGAVLVASAAMLVTAVPAEAKYRGCSNPWKYGQPNPRSLSYQGVKVQRVKCVDAFTVIEDYAESNPRYPSRKKIKIEFGGTWTCYHRVEQNRFNENGNLVCKASGGRRVRVKIFS